MKKKEIKQRRIELIKLANKNTISSICRSKGLNISTLYHGKYGVEKYNIILNEIRKSNTTINFLINEELKKNEKTSKI